MLPTFLIPEKILHESGAGEAFDLGPNAPLTVLTLGVLETVEQESLIVSIHGSSNGAEWPTAALIEFPQKFYEGVWSVLLDPAEHGAYRFIRAQWKTNRWGRGSKTPTFKIYLFAEAASNGRG